MISNFRLEKKKKHGGCARVRTAQVICVVYVLVCLHVCGGRE